MKHFAFILFLFCGFQAFGNKYAESLDKFYTEYSNKNYKESLRISRLLYKFSKTKNDTIAARSLYLQGLSYNSLDELDSAVISYNEAKEIFIGLNDTILLLNVYYDLGLIECTKSKFSNSLQNYLEGLDLLEKLNSIDKKARFYAGIGRVHNIMGYYAQAIDDYKKAYAINTKFKNTISTGTNLNGIGYAFRYLDRIDSAKIYFFKALSIFRQTNQKTHEAALLNNLAEIYVNSNDSLDKALQLYTNAAQIFKEINNEQYLAVAIAGKGSVFKIKSEYSKAIPLFKQSLQIAKEENLGYDIYQLNYSYLADTYRLLSDYKNAFENQKLFSFYSDSLLNQEKQDKVAELEKQYETEKKQNEIIRLQAAHELMDVQLQKNKQLKILGFVTASLLLIFVLFLLVRYFDKIKLNRLLEHKNQKIAQSENELRMLNASKNKFFSILAHDLKNPFHTVMGYSYLLSNDYEQFTEAERRKFASDIHHSTNSIFRLLQNLLEWSRSQTGRLIFTPREIEFKQVVENALSVLHSLADQKNIRIEFYFDDNLSLFADQQMIETVLRNLINNAIKFTPEYGLIQITANRVENQISICVKDSGIGISEEDARNLFQIDSTVKRKGTNNEDGSGLGLILCKEFVLKNNGNIWINSSPGNGSSFFFTVPAKTGKSQESIENDSSQQLS